MYGRDIQSDKTGTHCGFTSKRYETFFSTVWPTLDFLIFCGIPAGFLLVGNILIFAKVLLSKRNLKRKVSAIKSAKNRHSDTMMSSMTFTLITVNSVFIICNTPSSIFIIKYSSWETETHGHEYAQLSLVWVIVNILMYTNNACNFLLYIISGRKFRDQIKLMFKRKERNHIATAIIPIKRISTVQTFLNNTSQLGNSVSPHSINLAPDSDLEPTDTAQLKKNLMHLTTDTLHIEQTYQEYEC